MVVTAEHGVTPERFFSVATGYQTAFALKGAIDLDLFTAIGEGNRTAKELAARCRASERGVRILADYLCVVAFLTKEGNQYALSPDAAAFLDKKSPAYAGTVLDFLQSPILVESFRDVAGAVRKGGTVTSGEGTVSVENPVWVTFARAMMPMTAMPAEGLARLVLSGSSQKMKVLDIAGGHGLFGIAFARQNPNAEVVIQDWANVLTVAKENAAKAAVSARVRGLPGSAFEVDFGTDNDVILLANFLHHFDLPTNERLMKKVYAALKPGGRAVTLEFIPNDDRVTPSMAASFAFVMLASTPSGDAYTFAEYDRLFKSVGFSRNELIDIPKAPQKAIISHKA